MTESGSTERKGDMLLELPKPAPKNRRWTLLMVSDSGRIVRVKRVRGWITLLAALPVLAAAVVAGGYLRSDRLPFRDHRLINENKRLQEEVRVLRRENASLNALRLPTLEKDSRPETVSAQAPAPTGEPPESSGQPKPGDSAAPENVAAAPPPDAPAEDAAADLAVEEELPAQEAERAVPVPEDTFGEQVEVKDLTLDFNSDRSAVSAAFKIYNRRAGGGALFGFAFAILKPDGQSAENWLVFPETDLTPQGPVSFRRGYDFSISNYMAIKFNPRPVPPGVAFQLATILVFDASGRLLLARDFQLN